MIVHSDKIIEGIIEYATKAEDRRLKDIWLLSDFIGGRKVSIDKIVKILDSFDQSKEGVKTMREELHL